MGEPTRIRPVALTKLHTGWLGMVSLAAAQVLAAPTAERNAPSAVQPVAAVMLDALPTNRDFRSILDLHNKARAATDANPLQWNRELAVHAQQYADTLARTGTRQHSSRAGRENERENIIVGKPSGLSPPDLAKIWINEGRLFRPGVFPDTCNGDSSVCGHYTQIIWPTTRYVGCGYARAEYQALVCRYSPPGNRDGVAIGTGTGLVTQEVTRRLCTNERGLVINCGNEPGGENQNDGGDATQRDSGDEDKACRVDVALHRPISVDPTETAIDEAREFEPGATTLRNDDADWRIGGEVGRSTLPAVTLPTDIERTGNANENDLVRVDASNPDGLDGVYIFAFPTHAEASRELTTEVKPIEVNPVRGGRGASLQELAYFGSATKDPAAPGLPRAVPKGTTSFWTEAMLGGRYRMVIGKLLPDILPAAVRYNASTSTAFATSDKGPVPAFECEDQATLTAAVVDIYQRERSTRLTAFDVFWAGRPHFRAQLWPGDQTYTWGRPYRLGAAVRTVPGTAVDQQRVAFTISDAEDVRGDSNSSIDGPKVSASGRGKGSFTKKANIEGGFQIENPKPGEVPTVNRAADDRYPHRVSLEYIVNGEPLVRPEYLEIILPKVQAPTVARNPAQGTVNGVASQVQYSITDQFNRPLTAISVADYLALYGASLKAWEALEAEPGRTVEQGNFGDSLFITATGVDNNNRQRTPIGPLGTAQRSQAAVRDDRMTSGTFQDTLVFVASSDANANEAMWRQATGRQGPSAEVTRQRLDRAREEARTRQEAIRRATRPAQRRAIAAADLALTTQGPLLAVPQDVILQLRVGSERHDLMVYRGNRLRVFAPHFFNDPGYPGNRDDAVFRYHIRFDAGTETSQIVTTDHCRPTDRRC